MKADVALILLTRQIKWQFAHAGSENNFNHVMAANAKTTIVEAREIVDVGQMDPNFVHTPGILSII